MVYLNPDALHRMRLDVQNFINESVAEAGSPVPPTRSGRRAR
jgi:hypothetical protein